MVGMGTPPPPFAEVDSAIEKMVTIGEILGSHPNDSGLLLLNGFPSVSWNPIG